MADDQESGEEKKFPASDIKLRKLRRRGTVAHSRDFVAAIVTIGLALAVTALGPTLFSSLTAFTGGILDRLADPPGEHLRSLGNLAGQVALRAILPLLGVAGGLVLVANILDARGLVFSTETITPNPAKLDPVKGVKKLFSLRALTELAKSIIKFGLMAAGTLMLLGQMTGTLMWVPLCDSCGLAVARHLIGLLAAIGCAVLVAFAALDLPISRALFRRDQKMTMTEFKREQKEEFGDPIVKRGRKSFSEGGTAAPPPASDHEPNLWFDSGQQLVAFYYESGRVEAPVVMLRVEGSAREAALAARRGDTRLFRLPDLTGRLYATCRVGRYLPEQFYDAVATAIV